MEYWEKYNKDLLSLSEELTKYNSENQFNFVEKNLYNHVHDILVLSLLFSKGEVIKILDYGSNIIPWSNICNKISIDNLDVTIYDPFSKRDNEIELLKNFWIKILNSLKAVEENCYDFLIFGSSSQYIQKLSIILDSDLVLNCNFVLFTHTPLSTKEDFNSNQYTGYKGIQFIRSFKNLKEKMERNNFDLIFKSILPSEYASVDNEKLNNTIYTNLLFKKKL